MYVVNHIIVNYQIPKQKNNSNQFENTYAYLLFIVKDQFDYKFIQTDSQTDLWIDNDSDDISYNHYVNCIESTTDEGDIVLDPFLDITIPKCVNDLNRRFVGFEFNNDMSKITLTPTK